MEKSFNQDLKDKEENRSFNDTLFGQSKTNNDDLEDSLDREVEAVLQSHSNKEMINDIADMVNNENMHHNISAFATDMSEREGLFNQGRSLEQEQS